VELKPPLAHVTRRATCRLIPSRYPSVGIFGAVTSAEDLEAVFELEAWTNDRISNELGVLHTMPNDEWVTGRPMASVVTAAFCHPHAAGGRFNDPSRGAWYAAFALRTAHAEAIHNRTHEVDEIGGWFDTFVPMAAYLADFDATFHCVLATRFSRYLNPDSYKVSQRLGRRLLDQASNGITYPSVRNRGGQVSFASD